MLSHVSNEYILTYFWGMGAYFYWGDKRGWVEIFGEMNTPLPPWICTPDYRI